MSPRRPGADPSRSTTVDPMSLEAALRRFVAHYERLTRHILAEAPGRADVEGGRCVVHGRSLRPGGRRDRRVPADPSSASGPIGPEAKDRTGSQAVMPPSTGTWAPVMYDDSSEARNSAT